MTNRELTPEYIAGFFDGEGCVSIATNKGRSAGQCQLTVSISSTYKEILDDLQRQFGGNITTFPKRADHHKQAWQWHLGQGKSVRFLEAILPFLREKRPQAWLGLEFVAQRSLGSAGKKISEEEIALRQGYALAMKLAKRAA